MFNTNDFGAAGRRLNGEFLKTLPKMALKGTITGGGIKEFTDPVKGQQKVPFLTITSSAYEGEKELSLNATNRNILGAAFGKQANAWVGKEIGIYFDPTVTFGGKATGGVKVKSLEDPFAAAPVPAPAAPVVEDSIPF